MNDGPAIGFDDHGQPVPVCWPHEAELTPEARIALAAQDAGCRDTASLLSAIRPPIDEIADARAMEFMRRTIAKLGDTAAAIALRRVVLGDTTPLREAAKAAGVSHVAIHKQEKIIRKRLGLTNPLPIET